MDEELREAVQAAAAAESRLDELPPDVPTELLDAAIANLLGRLAVVNEIVARREAHVGRD